MRVCSEPEPLFASPSLSYGYIAMSRSSTVYPELSQPRPQGHLCGRGEELDDPGKGCPNLLVHWLTH